MSLIYASLQEPIHNLSQQLFVYEASSLIKFLKSYINFIFIQIYIQKMNFVFKHLMHVGNKRSYIFK